MTTTAPSPLPTGARVAVVAPAAVIALALGVAAVVLAPTLPGRIAVHFAADGTPDGWGSPWVMLAAAMGLALAAVALAVAALRARDRRTAATVLLVTNLVAGMLGTGWIGIAASAAVGDGTFPVAWSVVLLGVGAAAAAIPVAVLVRAADPVPAHDVAPLEIPATARVAWRGRTGSGWFAGIGAVVVVLGFVAAASAPARDAGTAALTGLPLVVVGLAMLALARVDVTVDRRGFRVVSAWTRIPIMRVPLARIESAGWEDVSPGQWDGWGLRVSGRGVAYVTRSGSGLVVRLSGGRARLVTVEDADRGAAVLEALLAGRRTS
ncbi:DUF1648 domain-containing protein [Clavibacter michiganensis subsp. michiganensis]|uniref:DUF1648 domain-containing protein n=1 Tax=Clavibacter michiganensis TaxID=28447 RepID=UPI00136607EA|nr:DUF1648 domain-containing protein [Clavibacter michiganensis]MBE3079300.1 DUF1648 domain-containing protein [Clavibacter michiganensis subsp. michiganensis]MDO4121639.1 DUF1648 domain-containing protein [Clavibacter michiganensis]MWJ01227.1 DUF1648 domain-containing protein [Clavibacter michiganensis subsp. michiganensis]MWJ13742.1 DUF1648 domain-containing protein [Clavibacter michiganensis subsp. michiganensis]